MNRTKTSDILVKCMDDGGQLPIAVIVDYYGISYIDSEETLLLIDSLYSGLIKYKGVTANLLHKCFLSGKLDELIHKKYTHIKSGHYEKFVKLNIKIGQTVLKPILFKFDIDDDDHCPNCNSVGYITKKYGIQEDGIQKDCETCCIFSCDKCSKYYKGRFSIICNKCHDLEIANKKKSIK